MWPVLVSAIGSAIGALLPRIAAAIGVFAVSTIAVKPIIEALEAKLLGQMASFPTNVREFLAFLGVYDAIAIIFSAYVLLIGIQAAKAAASAKASKKG
ncbi:DUF2523 domain-containing protein [Pseudomonas stutzeri]|uniref:DUF2523 domain-containing protein n=1 Tax=Stutzerimonas stutzeri TaxID=316 RepID=A0A2N8SW12_STUST|nr:DUF2523 family protein [Stutzerimonas stutzeri]MCQ4248018.1 DUF2523 domain-containing protein [Stutzerimonas stutzeri]PNG06678.1 hypothetical protein CXL00_07055 [Stutzerimonas stutzeri]